MIFFHNSHFFILLYLTNGKKMGRQCAEDLVLVAGDRVQPIDVKHPVGVNSHEDAAHVGVDEVADQ